ncbi:hypothetical protein MWU54_13540 [Marivita sp. S6314]|uniref:hypothetical protein n=1 Tax=Marivita sp. S6314 TaxID=2926406 RepID=UPI001FF16FE3|nr:hypothetical protein [Marivita sp. S6314]MCK0151058.1 hypothetical protein [Marivita sp. S6314]
MTLHEYSILSEKEKWETRLSHGFLIAKSQGLTLLDLDLRPANQRDAQRIQSDIAQGMAGE